MKLRKPYYFDAFRCIAAACPDSCCKEWDVLVDPEAAAFYRALPGALGEDLRKFLYEEEGRTFMAITEGRCPMWRCDGLCRIQAQLGHEALCETCREFPRLTHDYGDFVERGLELSCPEAARIILSASSAPMTETEIPGGEEPEYDCEAMDVLLRTRKTALALLQSGAPMGETLAALLLYGYQAQGQLDGEEEIPFDARSALAGVRDFAKPGRLQEIPEYFLSLQILTEPWAQRLRNPRPGSWDGRTMALARYLVERYWLQAVSDYDLYCRVKFIVIFCLLVKILGGDLQQTAQLASKEIENNTENVEAILDAAYSHPAFTDEKLLGLLLARDEEETP